MPWDVKAGLHKLEVTGSGDVNFKESRDITIERSSESLFIQTDKPAYKPGDKGIQHPISIYVFNSEKRI